MSKLSTKVHGIVDYLISAMLLGLPRLLGFSKRSAVLLEAAGATTAAYSLCTKYELGAVKLLPMKAHLTLDALCGGMLVAAAMLMDDDSDPVERGTIAGVGIFNIATALITRTTPARRKQQRRSPRQRQPSTKARRGPASTKSRETAVST